MSFKVNDHFTKKARSENYLARSIYKLEEIDKKFSLIHRGDSVLDVGYYPGSWVQYLSNIVGPKGKVVGIDIQGPKEELERLGNVKVFKVGIEEIKFLADLGRETPFHVLTSDMAPKTSGIKSVDQLKSLGLVEMLLELLPTFLAPQGHLVFKIFEGGELPKLMVKLKSDFTKVSKFRPRSTRPTSKECFVVAKGYLGVAAKRSDATE